MQKRILGKALPELIRCLCDCAHNVLQGNIEISHHHKGKLKPHKSKLRKLADRKVALKIKQRIIQKGGFLLILFSAFTPVISGVVGSLKNEKINALETEVYKKFKNKHEVTDKKLLSELDAKMQEILTSNRPDSEKVTLYNEALQKSKLFLKKFNRKQQ